MKLLLKEDVDGLGHCGDEVTVKDGYGRNYLVPQGKAILSTPKNLRAFKHQKAIVQGRLKKLINSAEEQAAAIAELTCTVTKKAGEQGKLYGAVTAQEIAALLSGQGVDIDRRKIQLGEPIKALGQFKVPLKLHPQVVAEINVHVVAEAEPEAEEKAAEAPEAAETPEAEEGQDAS
jgi:large subunit ribosomal protein L9